MENEKALSELLKEQLESRGVSPEKLQQLTDIPERYLDAILKGDFPKMPAAPYVRGYLFKIADILNLSGEELWEQYKRGAGVFTSGSHDRLPQNRFAIRAISKKWLATIVIGAVILIYLGFSASRLLGKPTLLITSPISDTTITNFPTALIAGTIDPNNIIKINNQEIVTDQEGRFEKTYNLQLGINIFEISAKKILGRETKIVKQIIYQPQQP